jgi:hypothetical protein
MPMTEEPDADGLSILDRAELQDHLLAVRHDLERLQDLLDDACQTLMGGFVGVTEQLQNLQVVKPANSAAIARAVEHLEHTARALQFQDMSTQLLAHASQRLHHCADRLAQHAFGGDQDADGAAAIAQPPQRANPVTQSAVNTGCVDLF